MKEQRGERRKRQSEFLGGRGLILDKLKHTPATGTGGAGAQIEWMRREGWGEKETQKEEYRAPARDRLQHAGFDHMAPPGAENTEPCDYPKHTGSAWVSEPGGQFPTLQLWTVWAVFLLGHSAESRLNLFPLKQDEPPLMPSEHDSTSFLCHRYQNKIKKQFKLADRPLRDRTFGLPNKELGKLYLRFCSLILTSYAGWKHRRGKPRSCFAEKRRHLVFPALQVGT